jgi:hypothetical protein
LKLTRFIRGFDMAILSDPMVYPVDGSGFFADRGKRCSRWKIRPPDETGSLAQSVKFSPIP